MLETDKLIRRAHNYLKRQSLNEFKIITFINNFSKILKNITFQTINIKTGLKITPTID